MTSLLTEEERQRAFAIPKNPEVIDRQRLPVRYHVEDFAVLDRPRRFLEAFAAILKHSHYQAVLDHYVKVSAKCSRCTTNCQVYLATGDPRDVPRYRSELLLKVYRRHLTVAGKLQARILGDPDITDSDIQIMADSFYNCTACRRCWLECPMGIDHGLVVHLGRYILSEIGIAPRVLVISTPEQLVGATGNTSGLPVPALLDSLEFLSEEIKDNKGVEVQFPIDQEGSEYLFFPAVSDYITEADTLMGIAAVYKATGDSWTIGTGYFNGINYGLFYSDHVLEKVLNKVRAEAERLQVKKILIGECGHASRSAKYFYPAFCGGRNALPVVNIMEYTYQKMREGKIILDSNAITEKVTYHNPCSIARPGWILEQPREIIKAFCRNFVEMTPNRRENICCGGGGGTVSIDEIRPFRTTAAGIVKAEQIRELMEAQKVDGEVVGLHDLLFKAIKLA